MVLAVTLIACFFFIGENDIFEVRVQWPNMAMLEKLVTVWYFSVELHQLMSW